MMTYDPTNGLFNRTHSKSPQYHVQVSNPGHTRVSNSGYEGMSIRESHISQVSVTPRLFIASFQKYFVV